MARSVKKGPYVEDALMTRVSAMNGRNEKRVIKPWARASTIIPDFVGHTFAVHTRNKFNPVYITENMVGHKLGELAPTRLLPRHPGAEPDDVNTLYAAAATGNGGPARRRLLPAAQGPATPLPNGGSQVEVRLHAADDKKGGGSR